MHVSDDSNTGEKPSHERWRVTTAIGAKFACRVYISGAQIEVRLTTEDGALVSDRVVSSIDAANSVAHGWLRALVADEGFNEQSVSSRVHAVH